LDKGNAIKATALSLLHPIVLRDKHCLYSPSPSPFSVFIIVPVCR
jgi:hypothetical protein